MSVAPMTTRRKHLGCAVYNGFICMLILFCFSLNEFGIIQQMQSVVVMMQQNYQQLKDIILKQINGHLSWQ